MGQQQRSSDSYVQHEVTTTGCDFCTQLLTASNSEGPPAAWGDSQLDGENVVRTVQNGG